jgi:hypothetical protein
MPARPPAAPDGPELDLAPAGDHLVRLVAAADAGLDAGSARESVILRLATGTGPDEAGLGVLPLEGSHPLDLLLGLDAPASWRALGVSCSGRAHSIGPGGRVRRRTDSPSVWVTVLLDRSGGASGLLRRGLEVTPLPGPPEGVVADACRRALGLSTAPPPADTTELWTLCWLDRVVDAGGRSSATRGWIWSDVARLHPASTMAIEAGRPRAGDVDPECLAVATTALARAWPWARLRAEPAVLDVPGPLPRRDVARWMDDGMWARWVLSSFPALDDLVEAAAGLLPADLAGRVQRVLAQSGAGAPR